MKYIFINLKRFDVERDKGGICPSSDAPDWIRSVMVQSLKDGLGKLQDMEVSYMLPESLLVPGLEVLSAARDVDKTGLTIGSQSVYRSDIEVGGNFGAFTSNLPAAAASSLGCEWSIIGHSEERRDKFQIMERLDAQVTTVPEKYAKANAAVNGLISDEVGCALKRDMNVLLCMGESAEEKGEGSFEEQQDRIKAVLKEQLILCLKDNLALIEDKKVVIGYEPIWAIGPGKTPPGADYIGFVSKYIKECAKEALGIEDLPVVYGGGLKEANAEMIAGIDTIDGGLVALTDFEPPIGFRAESLKNIIDIYSKA